MNPPQRLTLPSVVFLVVLILLVVVPPLLSRWIIFLLSIALAKSMVVLGVVLLLRGGLISFGHGLYFAAGAYAVGFAMNQFGMREYLGLVPLSLLAGGGLAAIIGLFLMRYRGIFFAMVSLAFSMILYTVLLKFYSVTGGTDGMGIRSPTILGILPSPGSLRIAYYYLTLTLTVGVSYLASRFVTSPLGYFVEAVGHNEIRVEYTGVSARKVIYLSCVFSGAIAGLGGGLVAFNVGQIAPELSYWTMSAEFVFVAVLGGSASVFAPVLGSIVFEFLRNYAFKFSPYTWQMTLGGILLLIIFFLPGGLWSLYQALMRRWAGWELSWKR